MLHAYKNLEILTVYVSQFCGLSGFYSSPLPSLSFHFHLQLIHTQTGMFAKQPPAISLSSWGGSRSLAIEEYWLVSHQCGEYLPLPVFAIIPNQVSFAEVPNTHQTSEQPFHES